MREILTRLNDDLAQGRECVYCVVVETRGSTPQKAGAAMLVYADGSQFGTLGGGCVEAEVRQRAIRSLGTGKVELHTFALDDNYGWDDGLICGGRMSILADPVVRVGQSSPAADYYRHFRDLCEGGRGCTEVVVMAQQGSAPPAGSRFLFDAGSRLAAQLANGPLPEQVNRHLKPLAVRPRPFAQQGIAFLPLLPRITLFIVGGGHVGLAVARLAAEVDFDVWVLDDRERFANRERFPQAQQIMVGDIGVMLKDAARQAITANFFCIIVTRGHAHDEEALFHLATSSAGYVGMIGSKRKIKLIYEDLLVKGVPQAALNRVHAPLGFDIGSQTVPEIAVSIVAELIAARNLPADSPRRLPTKALHQSEAEARPQALP